MKTFELRVSYSRGEVEVDEITVSTLSPAELAKEVEREAIETADGDEEFTGIMELDGDFYCISTGEEDFVIVGPAVGRWDMLWSAVAAEDYELVEELLEEMEVL